MSIFNVRREKGSLQALMSLDIVGPEANITIKRQRYGDGFYAFLIDPKIAQELLDSLHGGDLDWSAVQFGVVDQPWFPGAEGSTPNGALSALAQKLDAMSDQQYGEVFAIACLNFKHMEMIDPAKLYGVKCSGLITYLLALIPDLKKSDIDIFT